MVPLHTPATGGFSRPSSTTDNSSISVSTFSCCPAESRGCSVNPCGCSADPCGCALDPCCCSADPCGCSADPCGCPSACVECMTGSIVIGFWSGLHLSALPPVSHLHPPYEDWPDGPNQTVAQLFCMQCLYASHCRVQLHHRWGHAALKAGYMFTAHPPMQLALHLHHQMKACSHFDT